MTFAYRVGDDRLSKLVTADNPVAWTGKGELQATYLGLWIMLSNKSGGTTQRWPPPHMAVITPYDFLVTIRYRRRYFPDGSRDR